MADRGAEGEQRHWRDAEVGGAGGRAENGCSVNHRIFLVYAQDNEYVDEELLGMSSADIKSLADEGVI